MDRRRFWRRWRRASKRHSMRGRLRMSAGSPRKVAASLCTKPNLSARRNDAAGIDDLKGRAPELANRRHTVAGDTRHIVNDRDFTPGQAIEDGGFADVWSSDDGESASGHSVRGSSEGAKGSVGESLRFSSSVEEARFQRAEREGAYHDSFSPGRSVQISFHGLGSPWPFECICATPSAT